MASINGVSIKSLKIFKGHDGEPLYQGNVYYKGRKLGFWSQDAHGGIEDNFLFDESQLKEAVDDYRDHSGKVEDGYKEYFDASALLCEVADLTQAEKEFKKAAKKGYKAVIRVRNKIYQAFLLSSTESPLAEDVDRAIKDLGMESSARTGETMKELFTADSFDKVYSA